VTAHSGAASCLDQHRVIAQPSPTIFSPRPADWSLLAQRHLTFANERRWFCCCTNFLRFPMSKSLPGSTFIRIASAVGGSVGPTASLPLKTLPDEAASPSFPPLDRAVVVSIACDVVARTGNPLSRQSTTDLAKRAQEELDKPIGRTTVWRILDADAIKPWQYEHWLFPRAPDFFAKAAVVLDLYQGYWQGERLDPFDRVISSDEKTSIQARVREDPTLPPGPGRPRRVAAKYKRGGALQYLAAWDVQYGRVMGRCEAKTGIDPFGRLVQQVMEHPEYRTPCGRSDVRSQVFWVVDNGSSHRGQAAAQRLSTTYPNATLVNTPVNASWLNQVEVYFSILQQKVLTPNDSADLQELALRIRLYEELTNRQPRPFDWRFTKYDLFDLLQRLARRETARKASAPAPPTSMA